MSSLELEAIERLDQQASVYRLFARLWQREVDQTLLQQLTIPPISDVLDELGWKISSESEEELAQDFCALFVGPSGHRIPSQSLWTEGKLVGDATARMGEFWKLVSGSAKKSGKLADDHFGSQLEMMANITDSLIFQFDPENRTSEEVDSAIFNGLWNELKSFASMHLAWIEKAVPFYEANATTDFYRSMVKITGELIESELEFFQQS